MEPNKLQSVSFQNEEELITPESDRSKIFESDDSDFGRQEVEEEEEEEEEEEMEEEIGSEEFIQDEEEMDEEEEDMMETEQIMDILDRTKGYERAEMRLALSKIVIKPETPPPELSQEFKDQILNELSITTATMIVERATDQALDDISKNIYSAPLNRIYKKTQCAVDVGRGTSEMSLADPMAFVWPTNEVFTGVLGVRTLVMFIDSWKRHPMWRFYINQLAKIDQTLDRIYRYEVTWVCSTRRKPVPKVAANVYFTVTVSKIPKYKNQSVNVSYYYEGQRTIHKDVSRCNLCAVVLKRIMDNKLFETGRILRCLPSFQCI